MAAVSRSGRLRLRVRLRPSLSTPWGCLAGGRQTGRGKSRDIEQSVRRCRRKSRWPPTLSRPRDHAAISRDRRASGVIIRLENRGRQGRLGWMASRRVRAASASGRLHVTQMARDGLFYGSTIVAPLASDFAYHQHRRSVIAAGAPSELALEQRSPPARRGSLRRSMVMPFASELLAEGRVYRVSQREIAQRIANRFEQRS